MAIKINRINKKIEDKKSEEAINKSLNVGLVPISAENDIYKSASAEVEKSMEEKLIDRLEIWSKDFVLCCKEAIGVDVLSDDQIDILKTVNELIAFKEKVALGIPTSKYEEEKYRGKIGIIVKSAKGVGKTAILALLLLCMELTLGRHQTNLITAPREMDLKDKLFAEISHWMSHAKSVYGEKSILNHFLGLEGLKLYKKFGRLDRDAEGKQGVTIGRIASNKADISMKQATLQGFHDRYMLLGADECFGVESCVFEPLQTTMTGEVNFAFLIGNPTRNSGYAYDAFHKNKKFWITKTISAENCCFVSKDHLNNMKEMYKDYPNLLRMNVLGEFPLDEEDSLIPFHKIMDAVDLYKQIENDDAYDYRKSGIIFGCDIGCGGDLSVVYKRQGIKVDLLGRKNERDTMVIARWISSLAEMHNPQKIGVDGITWGKGVIDRLKEIDSRSRASFVDARKRSSDKNIYKNLRAELYMKLAKAFIDGQIAIPEDELLIKELSVLKIVNPLSGNKVQIISKKTLKADGVESPNDADAVMMTYFFNDNIVKSMKEIDTMERYHSSKNEYFSWMAM